MRALKTGGHAKNQVRRVPPARDRITATFNRVTVPSEFEKKSKPEMAEI